MLHSYKNTKRVKTNREPETDPHVRVYGQYTTIAVTLATEWGPRSINHTKHRTVYAASRLVPRVTPIIDGGDFTAPQA